MDHHSDRLDVIALGPLVKIGSGGQGDVFRFSRSTASGATIFKRYKPDVLPRVNHDVLRYMIFRLTTMTPTQRDHILERSAWPSELVYSDDKVIGFTMRCVPNAYELNLRSPKGDVLQLAEVQHLLNDAQYLATRGIVLDDRLRLRVLHGVAETLSAFHRQDITVGDLSPRNLVFSAKTKPHCFFLDCDAMRVARLSALEQAETEEWQVPAGEELATPESDSFKFALLVARLFGGDQFTRDAAKVARFSPQLGELTTRGLQDAPAQRPTPAAWLPVLRSLILATPSASPGAPTHARPSTARPGPTPVAPPAFAYPIEPSPPPTAPARGAQPPVADRPFHVIWPMLVLAAIMIALTLIIPAVTGGGGRR